MTQLIQPSENITGRAWGEPWKNCLNDEGEHWMEYKVGIEGLPWLLVGLNTHYTPLRHPLLHEGVEVKTAPS